jgi:hypothetical protein
MKSQILTFLNLKYNGQTCIKVNEGYVKLLVITRFRDDSTQGRKSFRLSFRFRRWSRKFNQLINSTILRVFLDMASVSIRLSSIHHATWSWFDSWFTIKDYKLKQDHYHHHHHHHESHPEPVPTSSQTAECRLADIIHTGIIWLHLVKKQQFFFHPRLKNDRNDVTDTARCD